MSATKSTNERLWEYAQTGDAKGVRKMISKGGDVNCKDYGKVEVVLPLIVAMRGDHVDVVELLLLNKADPNARDRKYTSPLHYTAHSGQAKFIKLLLEHGAYPNTLSARNWTSLHYGAQRGQVEIVRLLLKYGADANAQNDENWTPLHYAAKHGRTDTTQLLLEHGADPNARNNYVWTPLLYTAKYGRAETIRLLLEHGADLNAQTSEKWTSLHYGAQRGQVETVQLLLENGADANIQNDENWTPLHYAAKHGQVDTTQLLLEHGADPNSVTNDVWTPLLYAAKYGRMETIKLLLENGADLNAQTSENWTSLHFGAQRGQVEAVQLLLKHGADANAPNDENRLPLHFTAQNGQVETTQLLLEHGANPNALTSDSWTPLLYATKNGRMEAAQLLLEHGADANALSARKWTPLHYAVRQGRMETIKWLLKHGADADVQNDENWTPIHYTAQHGQVESIQLLLRYGADPNTRNVLSRTPLHYAAMKGQKEAIKVLAEWGADPLAIDNDGRTAMDCLDDSPYAEDTISLLKPFTSLTRAMKCKSREHVLGVLRQTIVHKDLSEMKARYNKTQKGTRGMATLEWKRTLTSILHDHKLEMVYFAFETEDTGKRNAIFEWINDKKWIQKATFSDGSTLIERGVAFQNRNALERMLFYGLDPYERSDDSQLLPTFCQVMVGVSVGEMISSYEKLRQTADALEDLERRSTLTRTMHDHKVEMLYSAFKTRNADKRDAIINWIDDICWIQAAKYENGPTLMQRAVQLQNLDALERMIRYRLDPYMAISNHQLEPMSVENEELQDKTHEKTMEIMKRHYVEHLEILSGSQGVPAMERDELIDSMLFSSTSMHHINSVIHIAVAHFRPKYIKAFIHKGLSMATRRCFVYKKSDRKLFINLIVELGKRNLLSEEEKLDYQSEATTVNTENTDWVRGMKASIQMLDKRQAATEKGFKTLRSNFNALVTALRVKEQQEEGNEKIRLAISLTCASLALFGGAAIKDLLETVVFMNDPGLVLDAITETSEDVVNEIVINVGMKHVLGKAHISPDEFVAKLEEAKARLENGNKGESTMKDTGETTSCVKNANSLQSDTLDEKFHAMDKAIDDISCLNENDSFRKENESLENNKTNQGGARLSVKAKRLGMWDVAKMVQKQQKEKKDRHIIDKGSASSVISTKPTFVDLAEVSKKDFRAHPLHFAVQRSTGDMNKLVDWVKQILSEGFSLSDTMALRVREDHLSQEWEGRECSAVIFASYLGYVEIVEWLLEQSDFQNIEPNFTTRCRAEDVAEVREAA